VGDFIGIAQRIASLLSELAGRGGISPQELAEIASHAMGEREINLYPGIPGYVCHDLALFISLTSPAYVKGKRGHLSCRQAIEKLVQHMQGSCMNRTRVAVLITDSWNAAAADEWKANLQQIARIAHIEIYLIAGQSVSEIYI